MKKDITTRSVPGKRRVTFYLSEEIADRLEERVAAVNKMAAPGKSSMSVVADQLLDHAIATTGPGAQA